MAYTPHEYSVEEQLYFFGIHPFSITWAFDNATTAATLPNIAFKASNAFKTAFQGRFASGAVNHVNTIVTRLSDGVRAVNPNIWAGTYATGTTMPNNVAMVLSLQTLTTGASGRGRMYFGGLTGDATSVTDRNQFTSTAITNLLSAATTFESTLLATTGVTDPSLLWGVHSRKLATVSRVQGWFVDPLVDTQRRRVRD